MAKESFTVGTPNVMAGVTDTYGADISVDATNTLKRISNDTKSDPPFDGSPGDEGMAGDRD